MTNSDSSLVPNGEIDKVRQISVNGVTVWEEHLLEELRQRELSLCSYCRANCPIRQELEDICASSGIGLLVSYCRDWEPI